MVAAAQIKRGSGTDFGYPAALGSFSSGYYGTAAAATAVAITLDANARRPNILRCIDWSYIGGTPSGGLLKVEDGVGNTVWSVDVGAAGHGSKVFDPPLAGTPNTAMIITLASGAGSVVGKLNVCAWVEE